MMLHHTILISQGHRGRARSTLLICTLAVLAGCDVSDPHVEEPQELPTTPMTAIEVPMGFDFALRQYRTLEVTVQAANDSPYPGVKVRIETPDGAPIASGYTGEDGKITLSFILSHEDHEVFVFSPAIGIVNGERRIQMTDRFHFLNIR